MTALLLDASREVRYRVRGRCETRSSINVTTLREVLEWRGRKESRDISQRQVREKVVDVMQDIARCVRRP